MRNTQIQLEHFNLSTTTDSTDTPSLALCPTDGERSLSGLFVFLFLLGKQKPRLSSRTNAIGETVAVVPVAINLCQRCFCTLMQPSRRTVHTRYIGSGPNLTQLNHSAREGNFCPLPHGGSAMRYTALLCRTGQWKLLGLPCFPQLTYMHLYRYEIPMELHLVVRRWSTVFGQSRCSRHQAWNCLSLSLLLN
jgi:hypothetical protein